MTWKERKGRSYYYQSEREGGRVRSRYVPVFLAKGAAENAAKLKRIRTHHREELRAVRALVEKDGRSAGRLAKLVQELASVVLETAGYRQHKRGEWRKRRAMAKPKKRPARSTDQRRKRRVKLPETEPEIEELISRAQRGDESALPVLRAYLDQTPGAGAWPGPAAKHTRILIESASEMPHGLDLHLQETWARSIAKLQGELAGSNPSPMERILAETAALCWASYHLLESKYHGRMSAGGFDSPAAHEAFDRLRDRALQRKLATLRTLALVRKLTRSSRREGGPRSLEANAASQANEKLSQRGEDLGRGVGVAGDVSEPGPGLAGRHKRRTR